MSLEKYAQLKLEGQLCFPMYAVSKEIIRKYKPYLEELDLTYTQYIAMMVLWEKRQVNVKELGACLYLDSGTLTPLLKKLEAKGYISRLRSKLDERNLDIVITEEGDKLRDKASHIPYEMAKLIHLSHEEALQLYTLLYKLLGTL